MEVLTWASAMTLLISIVNLATFIKNKQWDPLAKQVLAYLVGIALIVLIVHSDFASTFAWGDRTLDGLNWASQVLGGLMLASLGIVTNEFKKAIDNSDTAVKSPLVDK
jgi:hypothetical protein